jgi:RHS repeat-associated protein
VCSTQAFGTTSYQATNGAITAAYKRYRYTGMERDDETGLSYHNARYYIPWLGRWLNPDPIGIGDGVNVYAYCKNNPIKHIDKEGTQTTTEEPPKKEEKQDTVKAGGFFGGGEEKGEPWKMSENKKGIITLVGEHKGKTYTLIFDPKKPQEFSINNGSVTVETDFFTAFDSDKGVSEKSMSLTYTGSTQAKREAGDKDVKKFAYSKIGNVAILDVLKSALKSTPQLGLGIIGNAALKSGPTKDGENTLNVNPGEFPGGLIKESQFDDFTKKRAESVKTKWFGKLENVETYSYNEANKELKDVKVDFGSKNRNNTGITIFLFKRTFKPHSVRNGD